MAQIIENPPIWKVAVSFLAMLSDASARSFLHQSLVESFSEAIYLNHPEPGSLNPSDIQSEVKHLLQRIFLEMEDIRDRPEELFPLLQRLTWFSESGKGIWPVAFQEAFTRFSSELQPRKRAGYLSKYFIGDSLLEVGCGGGELLHFISSQVLTSGVRIAGVDVCDRRRGKLTEAVRFYQADMTDPSSILIEPYDTALLLSVLHHIPSRKEGILTLLANLWKMGVKRVLIEEDVLVSEQDLKLEIHGMEEIDAISQLQPRFKEYSNLSLGSQHTFTSLSDLLATTLLYPWTNLSFPFSFGSISHWEHVFRQARWNVSEIRMLGFQKGFFKQSCKALFVLDRSYN